MQAKLPRTIRSRCLCAVLTAVSVLLGSSCFAADELEKELLKGAKGWIDHFQAKGIKNVAVLKFRVKKGDNPASDSVGELSYRLSEKLERAMIVRNPVSNPIGIVHNANAVAAKIAGANHLNADGRAKLFTSQYPMAWGEEQVVPDAFMTGAAVIASDSSKMVIMVAYFTKEGKNIEKLGQFEVPMDIEDLLESGESFAMRGLFDDRSLEQTTDERKEKASEQALRIANKVKSVSEGKLTSASTSLHPLSPGNQDSPVSLEIRYDDVPQKLEFRGGVAFVAEPNENQNVTFVVRRNGSERKRLGVVLKVNGENTLYRQTLPDAKCSKWIFEPKLTQFGVAGFQIDATQQEKFKVLSQAASAAAEMNYGSFAGTISISVFPEQVSEPIEAIADLGTEDGEDFALMTRSVFPAQPPKSLSALKGQLAHTVNRGLIADGAVVTQNVEIVSFQADALPIMSATVQYYKAKR